VLLLAQVPVPPTFAGRVLENAGHTPLFILITLTLLWWLRIDRQIAGLRSYAVAGLIGVGLGILTEILQTPLHRDGSWEDVIADTAGVACALALASLFDRFVAIPRWVRLVALLVALACLAAWLEPIVRMTRAYWHRNGQFPVLADYRSSDELYWIVGYGVHPDIDRGALDVQFAGEKFPGVSLHEPVPDWRNFRWLVLDVENPDPEVMKLGVRVHDRGHGQAYADRFNRRFDIATGERQKIRIALDDIRQGPRERLMDMGHISDITLFRGDPTGSRHIRIYSLRLE
jgi:hypothetical protein